MMPRSYQYNTRRHVKIWLGPLNLENKLRLMNARAMNPDSEIHLVYDSRLINDHDLQKLHRLCNKHRIIPVDVVTEIIPECTSSEELNLI
jgi:hypothetical protein